MLQCIKSSSPVAERKAWLVIKPVEQACVLVKSCNKYATIGIRCTSGGVYVPCIYLHAR